MDRKIRLSGAVLARLCALGAFAGLINGLFGSGGGVAIVLSLWMLTRGGLGERKNVFANVTAIILPITLSSALVYFSLSAPALSTGLSVGGASLVGGAVGALLLGRLDMKVLRTVFAILLIISGGIMIFG